MGFEIMDFLVENFCVLLSVFGLMYSFLVECKVCLIKVRGGSGGLWTIGVYVLY